MSFPSIQSFRAGAKKSISIVLCSKAVKLCGTLDGIIIPSPAFTMYSFSPIFTLTMPLVISEYCSLLCWWVGTTAPFYKQNIRLFPVLPKSSHALIVRLLVLPAVFQLKMLYLLCADAQCQ